MKILLTVAFVSTSMLLSGRAHASDPAPIPTPRMLVETTDLSGVAISPDGATVAFREERAAIEQNSYVSAWYALTLDAPGPALRIADGGVPVRNGGLSIGEAPQWSADSQWLYFRALFDGEIQVWRASRDGRRVEPVTMDAANVERFRLSRDGNVMTYRIGANRSAIAQAEQAEYDNGVLYDDTVYGAQNLFRSIPVDGRLASNRTINHLPSTLLAGTAKSYRTVDLRTLQNRAATSEETAAFIDGEGIKVAGARAVLSSPDGTHTAVLAGAYPTSDIRILSGDASSAMSTCAPCAALTIEAVAWRDDDEIIFTARNIARGFAQTLYAWRLGEPSVREIAASDGLLSGNRTGQGSTCATNRRYAVCVTADAASAPKLERVDLDSGLRTVLDDPNQRLSQDGRAVASAELLSWTDPEGRTFTGNLLVPAGRGEGERVPLFMTYYRCPGYMRGGYGDEWPLFTLAGHGIAVLCINMQSLNPGDAVADYDAALSGIETVVALLDDRGLVDRGRIGMGGLSFGSEVVTWVSAHSDILTTGSLANVSASPTWYLFHAHQAGFADQAMNRWGLGLPDETPDQWRKLSPVYFPDRIRAPLLMQLSEGEYRTAIEQVVRMNRPGPAAELWVFPNETHQKYEPRHKLAVYERNLDWFRYWLQDYIDPDPSKRAQYERWSAMRALRDSRQGGAQVDQ